MEVVVAMAGSRSRTMPDSRSQIPMRFGIWNFECGIPALPLARLAALAAVAAEGAGGGELTELVADHVLGHVQLDEVPPVVDGKVLADELGHDRAGARPGPDRLAVAAPLGPLDLLEQ